MEATNLPLEERILLVTDYRLLKFLERASHRCALKEPSFEDLTDNELMEKFSNLFIEAAKNNSFETEEYFHSNEIVEQGALFKALESKDLLAEAIVHMERIQSSRELNEADIEERVNFLDYCIKNPQELNKYKGGIE